MGPAAVAVETQHRLVSDLISRNPQRGPSFWPLAQERFTEAYNVYDEAIRSLDAMDAPREIESEHETLVASVVWMRNHMGPDAPHR